ncbi:hypothetical protein GCM10010080_08200 [Thermomonas carbonis]|nr:hypothetical protein GCM10010080_08200 [Thermomonas carbonis]
MRAQQAAIAEVERVVHGARRVVRREVQRLEVVEIVLDFRAVGEFVAKPAEDLGDPLQRAADRMHATAGGIAAGQSDVDGFAGQARVQRGIVQRDLACKKRFADRIAGAVDRLARSLALLAGQRAQGLQLGSDAAALAEQAHAQRFQCIGRGGRGNLGQRLRGQRFDVAHVFSDPHKHTWGRTCALPHVMATEAAATTAVE